MQKLGIEHRCQKCHQSFTADVQDESLERPAPRRLSLDDWTVFAADSLVQDLPLPQQAEAEVCSWLKFVAGQLNMIGNSSRLYGTILFNPLGELYDFEISPLSLEMLNLGFNSWMNTLASGEVLLDIVNGLVEKVVDDSDGRSSVKWNQLPVKRMLSTAPNKLAICAFLLNHNCLLQDFLGPILRTMRPIELPVEPGGPVRNIRQAVSSVQHVGHTLLRNSYLTREWTWKALMLIVMTLMALTGSMGQGLKRLYSCLTGEPDVEQLAVPELSRVYQLLKNSQLFVPADTEALEVPLCQFPYKRVLKQGQIEFKSQLTTAFNLE